MDYAESVQLRDANKAFNDAIEFGWLSSNTHAENYAGRWMYMYSRGDVDYFKHKVTREYLEVERTKQREK